jgi:hypothetical protein
MSPTAAPPIIRATLPGPRWSRLTGLEADGSTVTLAPASWHGTVTAPDPQATAALIEAYVKAGGHPSALDPRAGLPPEEWALGWHRIWAADWCCEQLELGWVTGNDSLAAYGGAITRHLAEAARLLRA